jgi:acetylornithine deacetylase/succinyl-diaminopimelate desuccinylase-like protein
MKGGLIAGLHAIHAVHEAYGPLRGTVVFESVIEEECGGAVAAAREHGSTVDAAPIPEITGEDIQIANLGVLWFRRGRGREAGHGFGIDVDVPIARLLRSVVHRTTGEPTSASMYRRSSSGRRGSADLCLLGGEDTDRDLLRLVETVIEAATATTTPVLP